MSGSTCIDYDLRPAPDMMGPEAGPIAAAYERVYEALFAPEMVECKWCYGLGLLINTSIPDHCPECGGTGTVQVAR